MRCDLMVRSFHRPSIPLPPIDYPQEVHECREGREGREADVAAARVKVRFPIPPSLPLSHTFPSPLTHTLCHHYPMPIASTDSLGEQIHSLPLSLSRGHLVIWSMLQFRRGPWTTAARARWWDGRTRTDAASLSYDSIWQRSASSPASPAAAASHQPRGIISDEVVLDAKVRRERERC